MLRIGIAFVITVAVIPLAIAQQCNCDDMRKCLGAKSRIANVDKYTCERNCSTTSFGENAIAVQKCFKHKRAQKQIAVINEEKCLSNQANFCTDAVGNGDISSGTENHDNDGKNGAEKDEKSGSEGEEKIPELKTFKSCVKNCVKKRRERKSISVETCGSQTGCVVDEKARQTCKANDDHIPKGASKQGTCKCLQKALGKEPAEMPCNEEMEE